ncbi:MAG: carboxylating nicotinate-nucleotide diphosphorylase [Chloroflexia bacterium]|nr:carboxylating nicotinate-nucleotide diphosphorylase [Chloroflexia bacterium]
MSTVTPAVQRLIELALEEDLGRGDVTSEALVPPSREALGEVLVKAPGVLAGLRVAAAVFGRVDPALDWEPLLEDGARVAPGDVAARVRGRARSILAAERTALNFLQRLSGTATLAARYAAAIEGTGARLVDTRKTTPGWRWLEKMAVRAGGADNHRLDLAGGVLVKDNHLALSAQDIAGAVRAARAYAPHSLRIEIEVVDLDGVRAALEAGADVILLDNMPVEELRRAVEWVDGRALLEASGGITLETIRAVAETGVDLISCGALTHSAPALDISLEIIP